MTVAAARGRPCYALGMLYASLKHRLSEWRTRVKKDRCLRGGTHRDERSPKNAPRPLYNLLFLDV
jgi:hypothetical protein